MKKLITTIVALVVVSIAVSAVAQWTALTPDPNTWAYADGPTVDPIPFPNAQYRMGGAVGMYEGQMSIFSGGGVSLNTLSRDASGTDPKYWGNRQSHFAIWSPVNGWVSADGTDDTDNGDGTWTSVGLTGYNNGNGTNSPLVGDGAGYLSDQAFYTDGAFYVFGGYPQWGGNMAKYEIATNSWSQVAHGNNDGLYMDGGGLIGTHWYKIGIGDPMLMNGYLMDYDTTTDTFGADIAVANLIDPKFGAASAVIGSKLYVVDTWEAATPGAVYEIDPIAGTMVQKASALVGVSQAGSVVYDGKLYILGGRKAGANDSATDIIQVYDPVADTWSLAVTHLMDKRSGFLAEILPGDHLYVGNGFNNLTDDNADTLDDFYSIAMSDIVVPEPTTMILVALGGLLAVFRRKK